MYAKAAPSRYSIGAYLDTDTGRTRIGVLAEPSNVWYFPTTRDGKPAYGWKASERLLKRLRERTGELDYGR